MKKIFPFIILLIAMLIVAIVLYADKGQETKKTADIISVEDSIIVHDLKMDTDEPVKSLDPESVDGSIIFDNTFEESIIDYDKIYLHDKDDKTIGDLLARLRTKNKSWHITRYKIRKYDNLWNIAKRFNISHKLIIEANDIRKPGRLKPGNYLNIPNKRGIYYKIKRGDTVAKIARSFKVSGKKIIVQNNITSRGLRQGKKIFIPDAMYKKKYQAHSRIGNAVAVRGIRLRWPLQGKITSGFGTRKDPINGKSCFHTGLDISVVLGTPVKAAASGRVIFSGWKPGFGQIVILKHQRGYITVYAHNWKNLVRENQLVRQGQRIAFSGNTGRTTGAHLHFELRKYLTPLNPLRFL